MINKNLLCKDLINLILIIYKNQIIKDLVKVKELKDLKLIFGLQTKKNY